MEHSHNTVNMNGEKLNILMEILKILEKHENDPEVKECAMDIVTSFEDSLEPEQKNKLLKELLHFSHREEEKRRQFEDVIRREQLEEFRRSDYF